MKRLITISMTVAALCLAQPTQAQVRLGLKGGLNINEMSLNSDVFKTSNRVGFFLGPTLKASLPVGGLGLDISALYDQRDAKVNDYTIKQKSVIIPVNARLGFGMGDFLGLYVAAGPQFDFNVGDDEFEWTAASSYRNTFKLKKSTLSVNIGGGVMLNNIELGATYNIGVGRTGDATGFNDVVDNAYERRKAKTNSWRISATYYF